MTNWRAYPTSSEVRVNTVMAIAEMVQPEGYPTPPFVAGDEIQFDGPGAFIGTGSVDCVEGDKVTFTLDSKQFIMSKNTPDDFPSNTISDLRLEDWTVRTAL
jgi:hypothetical protein